MRSTRRLLLASARYLHPGTPTGLTGLLTHPSPRSVLIGLYTQTLARAAALPAHSAYRASVEALTRHRLALVESVLPAGWEEWAVRARKLVEENPAAFGAPSSDASDADAASASTSALASSSTSTSSSTSSSNAPQVVQTGGRRFVIRRQKWNLDGEQLNLDDGNDGTIPQGEGAGSEAEKAALIQRLQAAGQAADADDAEVEWVEEPSLTADQIDEIETKIGAGLIEEVIQVAEGELKLVDTMLETKVWEALEEKAPQGQWTYFERGTHMPKTSAPPS